MVSVFYNPGLLSPKLLFWQAPVGYLCCKSYMFSWLQFIYIDCNEPDWLLLKHADYFVAEKHMQWLRKAADNQPTPPGWNSSLAAGCDSRCELTTAYMKRFQFEHLQISARKTKKKLVARKEVNLAPNLKTSKSLLKSRFFSHKLRKTFKVLDLKVV